MDDYALVLNAGSSSLKFCVFQRPVGEGWRLEARARSKAFQVHHAYLSRMPTGEALQTNSVQPPTTELIERVCGQFVTAGLKAY
jgi:acetate kinase